MVPEMAAMAIAADLEAMYNKITDETGERFDEGERNLENVVSEQL